MIFIGGIQPKTRLVDKTPRVCPSCGQAQAYLKRTAHYLSLFFVPIVPVSRGDQFLACESCGGVFDERGEDIASPAPETSRCRGCGESLLPAYQYCPYCGRRL